MHGNRSLFIPKLLRFIDQLCTLHGIVEQRGDGHAARHTRRAPPNPEALRHILDRSPARTSVLIKSPEELHVRRTLFLGRMVVLSVATVIERRRRYGAE